LHIGDYQYILNNFLDITSGLNYIKCITDKYISMGYYKECIDCCSKVIYQYENYNIQMSYDLYFGFLFNNYVSLFYYDNNKTKGLVKYILKIIDVNPFIKKSMKKINYFMIINSNLLYNHIII
jgi:hypothetical protein